MISHRKALQALLLPFFFYNFFLLVIVLILTLKKLFLNFVCLILNKAHLWMKRREKTINPLRTLEGSSFPSTLTSFVEQQRLPEHFFRILMQTLGKNDYPNVSSEKESSDPLTIDSSPKNP